MADMAVAQLTEQRRNYEARIADLRDASDQRHTETMRTIKALADQVEFLRAQHFGPPRPASAVTAASVPVMPEFDFMPIENPHYLSEEEEEIRALHAGGHIDQVEQQSALDQLRARLGIRGPIQIEPS